MMRVVVDTNVLISALRSRRGASHRLLRLIGQGRFTPCLSVPLVLEYEDVAKRLTRSLGFSGKDIDDIIDYLCSQSMHCRIHFLWRPFLKDANDDLLLEVAIAGGARHIVTHNIRDFAGIEQFGLSALTPRQFLQEIGEQL
jgi:putative PIN family toxin of toxin-antitoxin system